MCKENLKNYPETVKYPCSLLDSEHDHLKQRRGLPSTAIKLLMEWHVPGDTVAANE